MREIVHHPPSGEEFDVGTLVRGTEKLGLYLNVEFVGIFQRIADALEAANVHGACDRADAEFKRKEGLRSIYRHYLGELAHYKEKADWPQIKEMQAKIREFRRQYPEIVGPGR